MTDEPLQSAQRNDLLRMGGATIVYLVSYAMLTPQVVVRLGEAGASATAVSVYGLAPFVLILAMSPITPKIMQRFGLKATQLVGLTVAALTLIATALLLLVGSVSLTAYVAFSALLGIAAAFTWTATEASIATHAPTDRIGSYTAIYQTGLSVSLAVGPFLPALFQMTDRSLVVMTAVLMGLALALALASPPRRSRPSIVSLHAPAGRVLWSAAVMILAVALVGGWFEVGLNAILPYVALDIGLSSQSATTLVGVLATGALLSQLPIFFSSDKLSTNALYRSCAIALFAGALMLAVTNLSSHLLWISAFAFGAGGGALYTLAMIEVARSRSGQPVATLTTLAVSAYTLGGIVGPFSAGVVLDLTGSQHLWIVLGAVPVVILLMTFTPLSNQPKEH